MYDIVARESLGRYRDNKDFHGFFHATEDALTGAVNRVLGKEVEAKSNLEEEEAIIKLPDDLRTKANELLAKIKKHDGNEELDDWYDTAMAVLGEIHVKVFPHLSHVITTRAVALSTYLTTVTSTLMKPLERLPLTTRLTLPRLTLLWLG